MLELAFETKELRTLCERAADADRSLGAAVAETLRRRLADLRAANSVYDVLAGRPRPLDGQDRGRVALELRDGCRLVVAANHARNPLTGDGTPDWTRVTRVRLVRIETADEHPHGC